jgi:hypothetical protein
VVLSMARDPVYLYMTKALVRLSAPKVLENISTIQLNVNQGSTAFQEPLLMSVQRPVTDWRSSRRMVYSHWMSCQQPRKDGRKEVRRCGGSDTGLTRAKGPSFSPQPTTTPPQFPCRPYRTQSCHLLEHSPTPENLHKP